MRWKRVESGTLAADLAEGLEARVADPLWLLAWQWQSGEFKGEDAANPLLMEVEAHSVPVERLVLPGGRRQDLRESDAPLEPLVEREPVRDGPSAPRVRAELGRLLIRALQRAGAPPAAADALRSRFPLDLPPDDGLDPAGRRRLAVLARSALDGVRLVRALAGDPARLDAILAELGITGELRARIGRAVTAWQRGTSGVFSEPGGAATWDAERMEYRFGLEATARDGKPIVLDTGDGYAGGRLDWYSFDRAPSNAPAGKPGRSRLDRAEVLPAPLTFRGMPAARFWELEEGDVYLGGIEAGPEDLARVVVAMYGVVYGDDWSLVPMPIPIGTLTEVTRVRVLDDFGGRTEVPAAAVVDGGGPDRAFKFFELTGDPNPGRGQAPLLFLPPVVETTGAGRPLEAVAFLRDEIANCAWAVEQRIESPAGRPVDLAARLGAVAPGAAREPDAPWRLVLATSVPDHWVPLVPVRLRGDAASRIPDGSIMFQRGRVPVSGRPEASRGARGEILAPSRRLLIHEEEIPRAGIRVVRRYQSARDSAGRLHTWVGRRKGPGRGEGSSGLVFDRLERGQAERRGPGRPGVRRAGEAGE